MQRIELYEKIIDYSDEFTQEQIEYYVEDLGIRLPKKIKYRRIYPLVKDIFRVKEIPRVKDECIIEFYGEIETVVKGSYDEISVLINDVENNEIEDYTTEN